MFQVSLIVKVFMKADNTYNLANGTVSNTLVCLHTKILRSDYQRVVLVNLCQDILLIRNPRNISF
jgi:hypothetical protein